MHRTPWWVQRIRVSVLSTAATGWLVDTSSGWLWKRRTQNKKSYSVLNIKGICRRHVDDMSEKDEQNMSQDSNTTPRRVGPSKASLQLLLQCWARLSWAGNSLGNNSFRTHEIGSAKFEGLSYVLVGSIMILNRLCQQHLPMSICEVSPFKSVFCREITGSHSFFASRGLRLELWIYRVMQWCG